MKDTGQNRSEMDLEVSEMKGLAWGTVQKLVLPAVRVSH